MGLEDKKLQLDADYTYSTNYPNLTKPVSPVSTAVPGATPVTTINAGGGKVTGPSITFSGGSTGYTFNGAGSTVTLGVSNAATVRSSISAAKSGANADILSFLALTGANGWQNWTGTPDRTSHATYSDTANPAYTQAQIQALMDSHKQTTQAMMAVIQTLLNWGGFRP